MATSTAAMEHKRVVELALNETLLKEAEAAGLDISGVIEDALRTKTHAVHGERWREENRGAIAWHNAIVERMGGTLHEVLAEDPPAGAADAV